MAIEEISKKVQNMRNYSLNANGRLSRGSSTTCTSAIT